MSFRLKGRLGVFAAWALIAMSSLGVATDDRPVEVAPPDRITGQIVDDSGKPIAGAEIFGAFDPGGDQGQDSQSGEGLRSRSDDSGQFRLAWSEFATSRGRASIWVYRQGFSLSHTLLPARSAVSVIRVVLPILPTSAASSLEVVGPRGEPLASAKVTPTRWYSGNLTAASAQTWSIPRDLGSLLSVQTGADGRVVLPTIPALRLSAVAVESGFGSQLASWDESLAARHRLIKIRGIGRVIGRVKADNPALVENLKVRIATVAGDREIGLATTSTDRFGRFEVAKVAVGTVEVEVQPRPGAMELPEAKVRQVLEVGGVCQADLTLRRGVRLTGIVRERGQTTPVAGAWVMLWGPDDAPTRSFQTDKNGRFSAVVLAGPVTAQVETAPSPFLIPSPQARPPRTEVPDAIAGVEWPQIELDRGIVLRGRVHTEAAEPVGPGALVEARWTRREGRVHDEVTVVGSTSTEGHFEVGPVAPAVDVTLVAHRRDDRNSLVTRVPASKLADPIELTLPRLSEAVAPKGRVIDSTGRPVADALVQFRVSDTLNVIRGTRVGRRLAVRGLDAVVTDEQGYYEAPSGQLDGRHRYFASAEAAGYDLGRTRSISGHQASNGVLHFPDLVIVRHLTRPVLVGQVVGTDGRPVAGVVVRDLARHQTLSNDKGWFGLEEVSEATAPFLFAHHPGYRFFGQSLHPRHREADQPLTLVLTRVDEPVTNRSMTKRDVGAEHPAVATHLAPASMINALIERILARNDPVANSVLLEHLAKVEPGRVAAWLQAGLVTDVRVADGLRMMAARKLAASDFEAAERMIATIEDPIVQARARLSAVGAARSLDLPRRKALIERVERDSRSIEEVSRRVGVMASLAQSWLDLGETESAKRCLGEAEAIASSLPRATSGARAWCSVIIPLARLDPKLARKRLDDHLIDPVDADRCRLDVARQLARVDPVEAVRTFRRIRDPKLKLRATPELCHILAFKDIAIARSLLDPINTTHPTEAAYALGMMAASLARTDRQTATNLLTEAFDRLELVVDSGASAVFEDQIEPAAVASTLLPVVEAVNPSLVPEFFWKSVSFDSPQIRSSHRSEAILALMLERYDPTAARLLFDPTQIKRSMIAPHDFSSTLLATALMAPEIAMEWVGNRLEPGDPSGNTLDQADLELVAALTLSPPARANHAARHYLQLWTPDDPATP